MSERAAILLAGGAGTRLWPLSTDERPKQFLRIFEGRSLLQIAFSRMRNLLPADRIFVAAHERHREAIFAELPELPPDNVLLEPERRNTAPAIAVSCSQVARTLAGDPVIGIFPSDHFVADEDAFVRTVDRAFRFAATEPFLVTIGIDPDHPNTGFGYLELGETMGDEVIRLLRFVEKPTRERAEEFVRSGRFVWNGGMFVWRRSTFENALEATAPEIAAIARKLAGASAAERKTLYAQMPSISIDFAVMEKAPNVATVRGSFGWSDVGSWKAVAKIVGQGLEEGVIREESPGSLVHARGDRPVILIGVPNIAVVDVPEGLLVIDLDRSEHLASVLKKHE
ncbi:MAG TPA: mannose-1-phosphate guanylyltransferase [Thermoanaerobaculia bacterium]|nr:mannose-1-phosphate guanylyltransferase [Thermoanaerobaculia bacterium]